ncbi:hypothetical protein SEA_HAMMY_49 [Mycobacterium phage Hammy]|uniref:Uncharacterized protein n=2 Tax=Amginevirus TaxID=2946794 RepID=A0A222ZPK9_9CAUD|nr:hypothetical protein I5G85_gp50 [Mycobacterium phage Amohnition]YP_009952007.1 hypothetical protein I5G86_gp50 [Mycobacterium phage DarthP]APD18213.1 hypothetical protein SEA_HAMMY_49 [Mycobacterium phage Hammy]ASR86329.1 hypothetical protein SEA_AMOHNITION_49 [Mycobacterium phage Amohnition]ASW31795.1 hypothetical protein SEA_DARTHP_49 [Mycobacterium phage DarthP]
MPCKILRHLNLIQPDMPTFAQQVEKLVGKRIDEAVNDPDAGVPVVLYGLAWETALTVEHLVEMFVARPLVGLLARAVS